MKLAGLVRRAAGRVCALGTRAIPAAARAREDGADFRYHRGVAASVAISDVLREIIEKLGRDPRVRYADVRFTDETVESIDLLETRGSGRSDRIGTTRALGVGVRVLGARTWGFASAASTTPEAIAKAAARAVMIADASSAIAAATIPFPPAPPERGTYATPLTIDPFGVAIETKLAALDAPLRLLLARPEASSAEATMEWRKIEKLLVSTEGSSIRQSFIYGSCSIRVIATSAHGQTQRRSYPTWDGCQTFQGGYERIAELALEANAPIVRDEAIALLSAAECPEGERDLILESSQVALQVHESCGHPTELDRALGTEITLAGGSFLEPKMLGSFRYGADIVTLTADAITPGGVGTFGWDDEGTPAGSHVLVDRGIFVDYLSNRETAAALGRPSTGTMRASGAGRVPLIRMTNVSLAPGSGTLEDLVADTKDGVLMMTDRSWSIDDQRLDFQFSCEIAWEIKNGKRTRLLRSPLYAGTTPSFWGSCDAICGREEWRMWGISTCGKGDPMQILGVGHGAAPARFRRVRVGSSA